MAVGKSASAFVVVALALTVVPLTAGSAPAAVGDVTPAGCIDDNDTGSDTCAQSADGLGGNRDITVSQDGKSVYATGVDDDALVRFDRDPETGTLTPAGCIDDNDTGTDTCAQSADGLDGAQSVAVSADGKSVYVAAEGDGALVRFDRDPETGSLTPAGCIDDNDNGADTCAQSADGLDGAQTVAVSADGKSVYVAGEDDDSVVHFDRDSGTGVLTPAGCIDDNDTGADLCAQSADGLDSTREVIVSPDGGSVYVTSQDDEAVVSFARDPQTGALTPTGCIDDNDSGPDTCAQSTDGLSPPYGMAIAPGGKSVYVAAQDDNALVRFDRDSSTGALTPAGCIIDTGPPADACAQSADGLGRAFRVAVSADGRAVLVASAGDDALVRFDRDPQTGALTPNGCIDDNDSGPDTCAKSADGLDGPLGIALSPDGKSAYVASRLDSAVARFDREQVTPDATPPETTITAKPRTKTTDRTPRFTFESDEANSTFECKLDNNPYTSCASPKTYGKLGFGGHVFRVRATDPAGNTDSTPAKRSWKIVR